MTGKIKNLQGGRSEGGSARSMSSSGRGAEGRIDSIYLRDPDGNLVEIGVYPERTEKR